jgi:beta-galactosidase
VESVADFSPYRLVVAPMLYLVRPGAAEALERFVEGGGTLVLTYYSGLVNENDLVFQGGFPGPLRKLAGVWVEEIEAVHECGGNAVLVSQTELGVQARYAAETFFERIHAEGAETLASFERDFYVGMPALTRNRFGKGEAYYVACRTEDSFTVDLISGLAERVGLVRDWPYELPEGVFVRVRGSYLFFINFTASEVSLHLGDGEFDNAETGERMSGPLSLGPRGSVVLRKS